MSASLSRETLEEALAQAEVGVWRWDPASDTMHWSDQLYDLFGRSPDGEPLSLDHLIECFHAEERARVRQVLQEGPTQGTASELKCRYVPGHSEEVRWAELNIVPETDAAPPTPHVLGTVRDITHRKRAQREREEARHHVDLLLKISPLALLISTPDGTVYGINQAFEEKFGLPPEDTEGRNVQSLDIWVDPEDRRTILGRLDDEDPAPAIESQLRTASGEVLEVEVSVEEVQQRGTSFLIWAIRDVTERNRLERQLRGRAFYDSLTGLPIRDLLIDRADHAIDRADRAGQPLTLLYVDIDDFMAINEEFGHPAGDELLALMAKRLKRSVRSSDTIARPKRSSDTVARIAGDEFALLLEGSGKEEAKVVAERIQKLLEAPFEVAGTTVHLSVSFGLVVRTPDDDALSQGNDLLRVGERAIYEARSKHKEIHVIGPDEASRAGRFRRREDLRRALRRDEFVLYYQPIVDLRDQSIPTAEALVRWDHPEEGLLSPSEFIPLAEETGLIADLDQWVLRRAIRQLGHWRERGQGPQRVNVNITALPNADEGATANVLPLLEEQDLPGHALTLETTERVAFRHGEPFTKLRRAGVRLAIDDFGTGYSALFYLHRFDADTLKIDRGFISELDSDKQTGILVRAIVDIAEHLGMNVIAEGVETEAQFDRLRELGCQFAQGYRFARPMPAEALEAHMDSDEVSPA